MNTNIKIYTERDYAAASLKACEIFAGKAKEHPTGAFGFATGQTPVGMYKELVKLSNESKIDLSKLTSFNLDEYYPIKASDPQSYAYFMATKLFDAVKLPKENRNIPSGEAKDALEECKLYEEKISKSGGIKLQILGIGNNGHIGFNEPNSVFSRETSFVKLAEDTVKANSRFFDSIDMVPKHAITMGIYTIMMAEQILLIASGEGKAKILKDALTGPITPSVPASALQLHRKVSVVTDMEAGRFL